MASENFAVILLLAGVSVIYISRRNGQLWQHFAKFHTMSCTSRSKQPVTTEETSPIPTTLQPYRLPPLRTRTSSRMAMGLKRLNESNWLTIDTFYHSEHALRVHMLQHFHSNVLQCLPGSEAACHETLDLVTSFLSKRFPEHFTINHSSSIIHNNLSSESYLIGAQCPNPIETAARLAMEDFNILVKDSQTGNYVLMASATLFPAGWELPEKIGTSMANLHSPVPGWHDKLGASVNHYFDRLSHRTCMERYNLFIQTNNELFQDGPEASPTITLKPEHITVRRERQTFTRLEKSGAVLFTVRTYMQPLTDLTGEEIEGLLSQIRGWEGEMKVYKGWANWGRVVEDWCDSELSKLTKEPNLPDDSILRNGINV